MEDERTLNAKLQQKKNALRAALKKKGVLQKGGTNTFDRYKYFSEAQYKELFTDLFSSFKLELRSSVSDYSTFEGTEKQANGRMVRMTFELIDTETGFSETSEIVGEGIDKGDKAGYKAMTGALKYYLACTFMVATGDDPEKESPDTRMNDKKTSPATIAVLKKTYTGDNMVKLLDTYGITRIEDIPADAAARIMQKLNERESK